METQIDYETEPILAVFKSPAEAQTAIERLRAAGIPDGNVAHVKLPPGRYHSEDQSLHEEGIGVRRGAAFGAPVGAAVGICLAAVLPAGVGPFVIAGLAGIGAVDGAILGGFVGAISRAHFDDDVAGTIEVLDGGAEVLVTVHAGGASNEAARAREALQRAGSLGFLDAPLSETEPVLQGTVISAGSALGQPSPPPAPA